MEVANFFWHGELGKLQRSSIESFIQHGFKVQLWSFQNHHVDGAISRDANEVLPEGDLVKYRQFKGKGMGYDHLAMFTDLFRYSVLKYEGSGWWFDTDCICLKDQQEYKLLRTNIGGNFFLGGYESDTQINGAVLFLNKDSGNALVNMCLELLRENNNTLPSWGLAGPKLVTRYINENNLKNNCVSKNHFYEINWAEMDLYGKLDRLEEAKLRIKDSYLTHVWNSSKSFVGNNAESGSLLDKLIKRETLA